MRNIVFRSGSLRMGGLERVLIEVLQNLNLEKYIVSLIIEDDSGSENIFLDQVPKDIEVYFVKPEEMIAKTHYHRERKKSLYHKIMYNYYMYKEHKYVVTKTMDIMSEIERKYGEIDVFVDYDWGARRYAEKLKAKKKVIWIHNSMVKMLGKESKIKRFGENLKKYDTVVAICDEMKEELKKTYPFIADRVIRIYNPFNFDRIERLSEDRSGLTEDELKMLEDDYIVAVSRLDTVQKDYATLIRGFKRAKEKGIKEKLYIVGDGPNRAEIENLIRENELEKEVRLLGRKTNPYIWMRNSLFFVHSSHYEGLPTVLIEAMITGRMVVSSDCPTGPYEILKGGECGILFEVESIDELSESLESLLKNRESIKEFEATIKERILEFRSDMVIKEYEKVLG